MSEIGSGELGQTCSEVIKPEKAFVDRRSRGERRLKIKKVLVHRRHISRDDRNGISSATEFNQAAYARVLRTFSQAFGRALSQAFGINQELKIFARS